MKLIDQYFETSAAVRKALGISPSFPLEDYRKYFWNVDYDELNFATTPTELETGKGEFYCATCLDIRYEGEYAILKVQDEDYDEITWRVFRRDQTC